MRIFKRTTLLVIFAGLVTCGAVTGAGQTTTSFPFNIDPDKVREFQELTVKVRDFQLTTGPVAVVPIDCERGTTGVMLIGIGKFRFSPEKSKSIEGTFRAAMLRFSPDDQPSVIPFDKGKKVRDLGATEMSRHMMMTVLRHCYQSTKDGGRRIEVLIPSKGAFAAVLYSKEHGDLLISDAGAGKEIVAFNFTNRKTLFERK